MASSNSAPSYGVPSGPRTNAAQRLRSASLGRASSTPSLTSEVVAAALVLSWRPLAVAAREYSLYSWKEGEVEVEARLMAAFVRDFVAFFLFRGSLFSLSLSFSLHDLASYLEQARLGGHAGFLK